MIKNWIVSAMREQISAKRTSYIGGCECVGIYKPTRICVVVAAVQVVKPGFGIVVVATVAEGVDVGNIRRCNIFGILAVNLYDLAPCVICVGGS